MAFFARVAVVVLPFICILSYTTADSGSGESLQLPTAPTRPPPGADWASSSRGACRIQRYCTPVSRGSRRRSSRIMPVLFRFFPVFRVFGLIRSIRLTRLIPIWSRPQSRISANNQAGRCLLRLRHPVQHLIRLLSSQDHGVVQHRADHFSILLP